MSVTEPFSPGYTETPIKRGSWSMHICSTPDHSKSEKVVLDLAKAFEVEQIIATEPKDYGNPAPVVVWGKLKDHWHRIATFYISGFPACCGMAIVAGCMPGDFAHTPARLDALTACYCHMARCAGYTRLITTEIVTDLNAEREKLAYDRAGFKVIEEFKNLNTGHQVYVMSKATRG